MMKLISAVENSYNFIEDIKTARNDPDPRGFDDPVLMTLKYTIECVLFIRDYCDAERGGDVSNNISVAMFSD